MHFNVVQEVIETVKRVLVDHLSASKTISHRARLQRKWGARDRKVHAEQCYELIRYIRYYNFISSGVATHFDKQVIDDKCLWNAWAAMHLHKNDKLPHFDTLEGVDTHKIKKNITRTDCPPAVQFSLPDWLYQMISAEYADETHNILETLNTQATVFLRINNLKSNLKKVETSLQKHNIPYKVRNSGAIEVLERSNLAKSNIIEKGFVEVQDLSSQQIGIFTNPKKSTRVIDACAGAGGKALHLADLMKGKGQIIALDNYDKRLIELKKRARRNDVHNIEVRKIEGSKTTKKLKGSADTMLLDVPCSGTGVWRRKPESKYFLEPEDLSNLEKIQQEILAEYQKMVKPGGIMVYATCSILPQENRHQIDRFLSQFNNDWQLIDELKIVPNEESGDGFYAAKLINTQGT